MTSEAEIKNKVDKIKELQSQIESLQKDVNVVTRNLQATRTGTFFVTLPRGWCEAHKLKKGSQITISVQKDSLIIIP